jgi:NAD-dependent SIR2 family protein deacetylase
MDPSWLQEYDAKVAALLDTATSLVVGVGAGHQVASGFTKPKSA